MTSQDVTDVVLAPGARLGRYVVQERIGVGGMGEVWRASVEGPGGFTKPVVLKLVRADLAARPELIEMLIREAALAARLSHPNLVPVFDLDCVNRTYFYAMEYVDGASLATVLGRAQRRRVRLPEWFVASVALACAEGLSYAHGITAPGGVPLGLVHGDVTLANIMVAHNGHVALLDFGIATTRVGLGVRERRHLMGKFQYLPPEVVRGEPWDHRTDVYELGMSMLVALTGAMPFEAANDAHLLHQIGEAPPPSLPARLRTIAPPLAQIVQTAVAFAPGARYATMAALAADLRAMLRASPLHPTAADVARFVTWLLDEGSGAVAMATEHAPPTALDPAPAEDADELHELEIIDDDPSPGRVAARGTPASLAIPEPIARDRAVAVDIFARPSRPTQPSGASVFDRRSLRPAAPEPDEPPPPRRWPWDR